MTLEFPRPFLDGTEVGDHILPKNLFAVDAANGGRSAVVGDLFDFLRT